MSEANATEFCRNFGRYQQQAQREPVRVKSHGRTTGVFVSEVEFSHYQELLRKEREVLVVGRLPREALEAIKAAEYPSGHEDLDTLMDEDVGT